VKVRVDLALCVGHGRCYMLAPDIYDEDERGYCRVLLEDVPPELQKQARMGEANCPEGAIEIDED
jgi:ferredoxin